MKLRERMADGKVRTSVLVGALVALLTLAGAVALALTQERSWSAESVVVVLPDSTLSTSDSAAYYETMSRGQIIATFAEVADNLRFEEQAEDKLKLDVAQRAAVTTTVSVVPNTSVILVQASAPTAAIAEQVADGTTALASAYLSSLSKPYRTDIVRNAAGSAFASGTSPVLMVGLGVLVALIAGLAVQQGVYHLLSALNWSPRRRSEASARPGDELVEKPATGGWW